MQTVVAQHYKVCVEFNMVEQSLYEVWEKLNANPFGPYTNVMINYIGSVTQDLEENKRLFEESKQ